MQNETKCLHSGYAPKNGEPRALPIYQSTTFKYGSTKEIGDLFDLTAPGFFYSRLANPTVDSVEQKIAALEGGAGALCTSSGQAANFIALMNILQAGDHFVSTASIYGGTVNLFAVTFKRFGIDCTFVDGDAPAEEIQKAFKPNTKAVFGETLTNPSLCVCDIEKLAKIAHENRVPLIIDNTFPTPILCRPFEFGADIVTHSTTKYMDGHALCVGGVVVDSGKFDWAASGKFPEFTEPDESYHGIVYTKSFGNAAYIVKARVQLMRDLGVTPSAHSAFLLNVGLETLAVRMPQYCANAQRVAEFLEKHAKIESVCYPGLSSNKYNDLAKKYLPRGCAGVMSVVIKGGRDGAARFLDSLKLATQCVHVADIRTCALHPASSTHRQLSDAQLDAAGIPQGMVRISVGLENIDDILADMEQALANA